MCWSSAARITSRALLSRSAMMIGKKLGREGLGSDLETPCNSMQSFSPKPSAKPLKVPTSCASLGSANKINDLEEFRRGEKRPDQRSTQDRGLWIAEKATVYGVERQGYQTETVPYEGGGNLLCQ